MLQIGEIRFSISKLMMLKNKTIIQKYKFTYQKGNFLF
jgi:hypothetical protein